MPEKPEKKPEPVSKPEPKPLPETLQSPKPDDNSFQKGLSKEDLRRLKNNSPG